MVVLSAAESATTGSNWTVGKSKVIVRPYIGALAVVDLFRAVLYTTELTLQFP